MLHRLRMDRELVLPPQEDSSLGAVEYIPYIHSPRSLSRRVTSVPIRHPSMPHLVEGNLFVIQRSKVLCTSGMTSRLDAP